MSFVKADGASIEIVFSEAINPISIVGAAYRTIDDAVVTTLNQHSTSYPASKLNNGVASTSDFWIGTTAINWIKAEFLEPVVAHGFKYFNVNTSYYPKTFSVSGSNNNVEWIAISEILNGTNVSGWQEYAFTNLSAYKFYKIDILTANSSNIYLSEIQFNLDYGNEKAFTLTVHEYDFVPNGAIQQNIKPLMSVKNKDGYSEKVDLNSGTFNNVQALNDILTLEVKP